MKTPTIIAALLLLASAALGQGTADLTPEQQDKLKAVEERLKPLRESSVFQNGQYWICTPVEGRFCNQKGCNTYKPKVFLRIDLVAMEIGRCNDKECETRSFTYSKSGIFSILDTAGKGAFTKVANNGSVYMEVLTQVFDVYTAMGECQPYAALPRPDLPAVKQ